MLSKIHNSKRGFTLIELMIVVVIIGILAALAIPRFMRATTKAKQSEAKQILKQIYVMEHAYRQEYNTYATGDPSPQVAGGSFPILGVEIMSSARYSYDITVADSTTFTVIAKANLDDDGTVDEWQIDQAGTLVCNENDAVT